jgi:hypothetical protein
LKLELAEGGGPDEIRFHIKVVLLSELELLMEGRIVENVREILSSLRHATVSSSGRILAEV